MQISYISKNSNSNIKNLSIFFILWIVIILLLLLSSTNFDLLKNTLDLYIYTVFPGIFPFIFLTNILIQKNLIANLIIGKNTIICKILKVSRCSLPVIIIGSIFGYPNSINYATYLLENGYISKKEYTKLLIICNNPSIIYILSSIGLGIFHNIKLGIILFLAITMSNLLICICYRPDINIIQQTTIKSNSFSKKKDSFFDVILIAFKNSFKSLMFILGFMFLFVLIANSISYMLRLNTTTSSLLFGALEISTGIQMIASNFTNTPYIIFLICFVLSFSSFMVILQLYSFSKEHLHFKNLITFKFIQGIISCLTLFVITKFIDINEYINVFANIQNIKPENIKINFYIYFIPLLIFILIYIKSSWRKCQLQKGDNV